MIFKLYLFTSKNILKNNIFLNIFFIINIIIF